MAHFPDSTFRRLLQAPNAARSPILTVQHRGAYVRYISESQEPAAREMLMGVDVPTGMKKSDVRVYPPGENDPLAAYWFMAVKFEPAA